MASETAEALEDALRIAIDTVPTLLWRCRPDGTAEFLNRRWLDYTGMTFEAAEGWGWQNAVHPGDLPDLMITWRRILKTGVAGEHEARLRRHDGAYRWFLFRAEPLHDHEGQIIAWCGTNTDIQDRRLAEEKSRQAEHALKLAIDTIPAMAWRAGADGAMEVINQRWLQYTGLALEQSLGWSWAEAGVVHPDDLPGLIGAWRTSVASGKPGEAEARLRRFDGEFRWFLFRAEPLLDEQGHVLKWYGTNIDLEDRRRAEQSLRKTQAQLAHLSRVTTLDQLAASIAHEVNQPLAAIVTNGEAGLRWLGQGEAGRQEARNALRRIVSDANRAGEVIRRIRDMSAKTDAEFAPVDMNTVISEAALLMEHEANGHEVLLRTGLAPRLPPVLGSRVQLQQVMVNLIINGIEAMEGVRDRPRDLLMSSRRHETDQIIVAVRDAGVGIRPEDLANLFNPFFTTKPRGIGMGLSICQCIIDAHGGRIWASRNAGSGATFQFVLGVHTESVS